MAILITTAALIRALDCYIKVDDIVRLDGINAEAQTFVAVREDGSRTTYRWDQNAGGGICDILSEDGVSLDTYGKGDTGLYFHEPREDFRADY